MHVQCQYALKQSFLKIEFENSIRRLSFLCCLPDIKIAWINPWSELSDGLYTWVRPQEMQNLDMKTMDYFSRVSLAMILGIWIQYPQIALNWSPKYANIGITQTSDGLQTWLRPYWMWNLELKIEYAFGVSITIIWGFGLMALRHWIPNPGIPCSKPLGDSKVDSAFHPSEVDKMSTRNFWELNGKK